MTISKVLTSAGGIPSGEKTLLMPLVYSTVTEDGSPYVLETVGHLSNLGLSTVSPIAPVGADIGGLGSHARLDPPVSISRKPSKNELTPLNPS